MPAAAPMDPEARRILLHGVVIPAHPLALNSHRKLDERRQRALTRYYCESGAGGLAVGVHTTQFAVASWNYNSGDSFWRWRTWWRLRWPPSTATTPLMSFAPWPRATENPKSPFIPAMTTTSFAICSQTSVSGQRIALSALISL